MSYRIKDPDTGEFITIANGSRMFVGTTAAIDAAIARGELKYPDLYACTDDYPTGDDTLEDRVEALESISRINITVPTGIGTVVCYRNGNVVTVSYNSGNNTVNANTTLATGLPKPANSSCHLTVMSVSDGTVGSIVIHDSGELVAYTALKAYAVGCFSYITKE